MNITRVIIGLIPISLGILCLIKPSIYIDYQRANNPLAAQKKWCDDPNFVVQVKIFRSNDDRYGNIRGIFRFILILKRTNFTLAGCSSTKGENSTWKIWIGLIG